MQTIGVSEAKARLNELVREAHGTHERVHLTRNGRVEAVLMSIEDLTTLEETLAVLADPEAVADIIEGRSAMLAGEAGSSLADLRADVAARRG